MTTVLCGFFLCDVCFSSPCRDLSAEKYPPRPETVQPPSTPRGLFGEGGARTTQDFHIPTSRRQAGSIALPSESASFGLGRRSTSVVDVFSAEASWDPVFVVAPTRLVGLQNEKAVRERGTERARRAAWHRIDGPEVSSAVMDTTKLAPARRPCNVTLFAVNDWCVANLQGCANERGDGA